MTKEMPFFCVTREPEMVPQALIEKCRNRLDAIRLCIQLSGYTNETICDALGIDKGHFSRMMKGRANFPDKKSVELIHLCGNRAPTQYEAWATGCELVANRDKQIADLEKQLKELKGKAA